MSRAKSLHTQVLLFKFDSPLRLRGNGNGNGNGGERTRALEGLCPSKHTNNVVKGKHNNELIVLRECHNECESHYAQCF